MTEKLAANIPSRPTFGERVITRHVGDGEYLLMEAPVKNVVSFNGSFVNIPDYSGGQELVRDLSISMLDKGTEVRSKSELALALEGIGALITFSTDGLRTRVSGRSLTEDVPKVLEILAEQLFRPSFPEDEFDLLKGRYEAALHRSLTDTASLADGALSRRIYGHDHPFYTKDPESDLELLRGISVAEIRQYFAESVWLDDWKLAIVGDSTFDWFDDVISAHFVQGTEHISETEMPDWTEVEKKPGMEAIFVQDRENINVVMGHAINVSPTDDAYLPLFLGNYVLGGNFSARLMNVIRDELGLTYGIHSSLAELDRHHYGTWKISVTLSQDALDTGIKETRKLIDQFVEEGVTEGGDRRKEGDRRRLISGGIIIHSEPGERVGSKLRERESRDLSGRISCNGGPSSGLRNKFPD